jgi:hypothetical protein
MYEGNESFIQQEETNRYQAQVEALPAYEK